MAEPFLSLGAGERADILRTAAARSRRSTVILEKDIWICWGLDALFSMRNPHPMAFKGGTSLSKVYGVIDRFSEDVDVTLDYRHFDDGFDPFADGASRTATKQFSERLRDRVARNVRDVVAPARSVAWCTEQCGPYSEGYGNDSPISPRQTDIIGLSRPQSECVIK